MDSLPYLVYLVFTLGAAGVYFMMPRLEGEKIRIGAVFGIAAAAALIALLAGTLTEMPGRTCVFVFAAIAVSAAARVITHPVPVYSALYFVLVVVAVAALLVLRGAEFTAVALVIVYAGAILVTYLFVIMLAQQSGMPAYDRNAREPFMAVLAGFVLMAAVAGKAAELPTRNPDETVTVADQDGTITKTPAGKPGNTTAENANESNTLAVGNIVMTRYVVTLQIAAILLLISMVGAIAISRRKVPVEGPIEDQQPLGKAGKEVKPF